ncbi:hypothetical protein IFM89_030005 [Coptis chinensis]|uniref:Uncharacterized protein n=1 Tax=Coptis chinensis TaxID=261450 RepID=A0A835IG60_9MAGN|nr:hypothetical protein IFM89_030005 [Coptis chinensis]
MINFKSAKKDTNHNGNYSLTLFQPPGPDHDLGLRVGKNKATFIINPNKYPIFSMRCIYWNIRGIANDKSQNRLSKLINKWEPEIVGIAEPMIYPNDLPISFLQSLGMSSAFYSNPNSDPNKIPNI